MSTLEAEAYVPPLNLHPDSLVALATRRLEDGGMAAKIENSCKEVRRYAKRSIATCGPMAKTGGGASLNSSAQGLFPGGDS